MALRGGTWAAAGWLTVLCLLGNDATAQSASNEDVCKAAIAKIMGRDPAIMAATSAPDGVFRISYVRPDDGSRWAFKCRLEGNRAHWGNADGRWRTNPADEVLTFSVAGKLVTITERFDDGSSSAETFTFR